MNASFLEVVKLKAVSRHCALCVVVLVAGDGNAGGLYLPVRPAPEAAYTPQQLTAIHPLRPKEEQELPRVKGQFEFPGTAWS